MLLARSCCRRPVTALTTRANLIRRTTNSYKKRSVSYVLGIETSCDDTAVAVVTSDGRILSECVSSQWELNAKWKGIVPALAARSHEENLPLVLQQAMQQSGLQGFDQLNAVAVTSGPGLAPCLNVGLITAMKLCQEHAIDLVRVNHLEAHLLVSRMPQLALGAVEFPFVVLLVSGGHCCLVLAKGIGQYEVLGQTVDDSIGEAFDKVARMLEITSPAVSADVSSNHQQQEIQHAQHGGKLIEDMAKRGDPKAFYFPEAMKHRKDCDFSYSGIKTAMLREIQSIRLTRELDETTKADLCASFQTKAIDQLVTRTSRAFEWARERIGSNKLRQLVVCGGVASNQVLRERLDALARDHVLQLIVPPSRYCTDNGVMVAWTGMERWLAGSRDVVEESRYTPRWPLDQLTPPPLLH